MPSEKTTGANEAGKGKREAKTSKKVNQVAYEESKEAVPVQTATGKFHQNTLRTTYWILFMSIAVPVLCSNCQTQKPKQPKSAYTCFATETMKRLRDEGVPVTEAMKKAGALWSEVDEEGRKPYEKAHDEDVKR